MKASPPSSSPKTPSPTAPAMPSPWVRRLGKVLGASDQPVEASYDVLASSGLFGFVEEKVFTHWQDIHRESIVDLALSQSHIASLGEEERANRLAEVLAFYNDFGRGMDGMQIPYKTRCLRAQVIERPGPGAPAPEDDDAPAVDPERPIVSDGTDTDMLLIDFR